jgi:hypothetical protein
MKYSSYPARHRERGQTLPITGICLVLIFSFAALAIDAGYLEYKQRLQQTAADAAAIAAAWSLIAGNSQSSTAVLNAAQTSAATNGFTDDGGATVSVKAGAPGTLGPSSPNAGNSNAVEVDVTAKYPAIFSAIVGHANNWVSARAVAIVQNQVGGPCIWALHGDFTDNVGTVNGPCGIVASKNVQANNCAAWTITSIAAGGHSTCFPSGAAVSQTVPSSGIVDPCYTIPGCVRLAMTSPTGLAPLYPLGSTPGTGPATDQLFSSCLPAPGLLSGVTQALVPECYAGLPDGGTFDLTPGVYVFQGDVGKTNGVSLTCSTCVQGSTGVTLVVGGQINLNGGTTTLNAAPNYTGTGTPTVDLSTVGSNGVPGVLLYQPNTGTSPENFSAQSLLGMIYAPNEHINLNAGSTLTVTFVVAGDLVLNGGVVQIPTGNGYGASQVPVLAE